MPVTFSNPRLRAEITDYPLGGSKRGLCVFSVESHPTRGYRFTRQTFGKPKTDTYGGPCAIVDGSDGRTYLLQTAAPYKFIKVSRSDFKDASESEIGFKAAVFEDHEMYPVLKALIEQANLGAGSPGNNER